jgi:uncharacterized protein with NRDE domain
MCTIVVLRDLRPDWPVVIAANRDEFYAREATGPQLLCESPRAVGGRDLVSGGTWMGVTAGGFFAGVTNQRTDRGPDPSLESRGVLVTELLRTGGRAAARALLRSIDGRRYNEFNLIFGDAGGLEVGYGRAERAEIELEPVPPGLTVLPNDRLDSPEFPKVDRVRALLDNDLTGPWNELADRLRRTLADHRQPDDATLDALPQPSRFDREILRKLHAICVHTDFYGTRSSTLLALAPGRVAHYAFADGPPCTAELRDRTELLH